MTNFSTHNKNKEIIILSIGYFLSYRELIYCTLFDSHSLCSSLDRMSHHYSNIIYRRTWCFSNNNNYVWWWWWYDMNDNDDHALATIILHMLTIQSNHQMSSKDQQSWKNSPRQTYIHWTKKKGPDTYRWWNI